MNSRSTTPPPPAPDSLPGTGRLLVAFSGGPDSSCLLHLLHDQAPARPLVAVHVDHNLDDQSAARAEQARDRARALGIPFELLSVFVDRDARSGLEAAARKARYRAMAGIMQAGDCLLTAHHADDQVETVMLRLLRGSGAAALGGIRAVRRFGPGWLCRPLLHWRRRDIERHLQDHGLDSIADPLNRELGPDRNYLRNVVLPEIERRWPGYRGAILKAAELCAGAGDAVHEQAAADFRSCSRRFALTGETVLDAACWLQWDRFRAAEMIRLWCREAGLSPPPARPLKSFFEQCRMAAADQAPRLDWAAACLHRFGGFIWIDRKPLPPDNWRLDWQPPGALELPAGLGCLRVAGPDQSWPHGRWQVGSGTPGESIRLPGRTHHSPVRELLRAAGVPPWRRRGWPRIYRDGKLMWVAPGWAREDFGGLLDRLGAELLISWDFAPGA